MSSLWKRYALIGLATYLGFVFTWGVTRYALSVTPSNALFSPTLQAYRAQEVSLQRPLQDQLERQLADLHVQNHILEASIQFETNHLKSLLAEAHQQFRREDELRTEIAQLQQAPIQTLNLPTTPEEYGIIHGSLLRRRTELYRTYPEMRQYPFTPPPETPRYQQFVEEYDSYIRDCIVIGVSPLKQNLKKQEHVPAIRRQLAKLDTQTIVVALSLPPQKVPIVEKVCESIVEDRYLAQTKPTQPAADPRRYFSSILTPTEFTQFSFISSDIYPTISVNPINSTIY